MKKSKEISEMLIRKDNWLVQKTINKFSKGQNRLMCLLLGKYVNLNTDTCMNTTLSVEEFRQALELSDGEKNYARLRKEVMRFGENGSVGFVRLNKKGEPEYVWMPYFSKIELSENNVEFQWNPNMKPHLIDLKDNYTQYLASDYLKLKSIYSQNLYEQLKSVEKYETAYRKLPRFTVEELRKIMRVDKKYPSFHSFKTVCLARAIKEINEVTDLYVEMETEKSGRSVVACLFRIRAKNERFEYNGCLLSQNEIDNIIYRYKAKNKIYDLARIKKTQPDKYKKLRHGGKSDYDIIINFISRDSVINEQEITDFEEQTALDGSTIEQGILPF